MAQYYDMVFRGLIHQHVQNINNSINTRIGAPKVNGVGFGRGEPPKWIYFVPQKQNFISKILSSGPSQSVRQNKESVTCQIRLHDGSTHPPNLLLAPSTLDAPFDLLPELLQFFTLLAKWTQDINSLHKCLEWGSTTCGIIVTMYLE